MQGCFTLNVFLFWRLSLVVPKVGSPSSLDECSLIPSMCSCIHPICCLYRLRLPKLTTPSLLHQSCKDPKCSDIPFWSALMYFPSMDANWELSVTGMWYGTVQQLNLISFKHSLVQLSFFQHWNFPPKLKQQEMVNKTIANGRREGVKYLCYMFPPPRIVKRPERLPFFHMANVSGTSHAVYWELLIFQVE